MRTEQVLIVGLGDVKNKYRGSYPENFQITWFKKPVIELSNTYPSVWFDYGDGTGRWLKLREELPCFVPYKKEKT